MNGIGLIWHRQGAPVDPHELENMASALRLGAAARPSLTVTGAVGFVANPGMFMPAGGRPPVPAVAGDGRWHVLFDGRLNHRTDLAASLGINAADAARLPDAVLAARAWGAWGESGLDRWYGDFACIIWDSAQRDLFLFCDPFGRRPLHYFADQNRILASSMPRGIHAVSGIVRKLDRHKIADIACGLYLHRSQTCFEGISAVEAGEIVRFTPHAARQRFFYRLEDHIRPIRYPSDDQYVAAMAELVDVAVADAIAPDDRIAVAMSGGLDSTSIAVIAATHLPTAQPRLPVYTLVPDPDWDGLHEAHVFADEAPYARAVANHCPALDLHLVDAAGRGIFDMLDRVHAAMEMPQTNIMNMVWFDALFARAQADGATVLLDGEMGNVGFSHCGSDAASQLLHAGDIGGLMRQLLAEADGQVMRAARRLPRFAISELQASIPQAARTRLLKRGGSRFLESQSRALRPGYIAEMKVVERVMERLGGDLSRMTGRRSDFRYLGFKHHMLASAGVANFGWQTLHGLDCRDPLADRKLIEWSLGVPEWQYRRGGEKRGLAKRVMQGRLPDEVLYKPIDNGRQGADWHARLTRDRVRIAEELERFACDPELAAMFDLDRLQGHLADWPDQTPVSPADSRRVIQNEIPNALSIGGFVLDSR
jgi:asparagine synthase (glutamine-hydrolysing)